VVAALATSSVTREVSYGVRVSVDGVVLDFDDDMMPFIMDGRTFLPVRGIAEALGLYVGFDAEENTVLLSTAYIPQQLKTNPFDDIPHGTLAKQYISFINDNLPERIAFSYRELETAEWIVNELISMGYTQNEIETQVFSRAAAQLSTRARTPLHSFNTGEHILRNYSQNILLTIPGQSERKIIVAAHYDTLLYPGASDNASGMGVVLESAHRMRYLDNYYTIVYAFFGAEEVWWIGALYYLEQLSEAQRNNIELMINVDVLLDGDTLIYAAGYGTNRDNVRSNTLTARIDGIANDLNARYNIGLTANPRGIRVNADHAAFFYAGHTVLFMFGARYANGRFNLDVFHSARDDIRYITANRTGRKERNIRAFSIFLEELLMMTN